MFGFLIAIKLSDVYSMKKMSVYVGLNDFRRVVRYQL